MTLLYCGRMDDHDEHDWPGKQVQWSERSSLPVPVLVDVTYHCKGTPVSEGAAPCMECGNPSGNGGPLCIRCALEHEQLARERDEEWWL